MARSCNAPSDTRTAGAAAAVAAFAVTEAFGATPLRRVKRNPFSTPSDSVPENKILKNERKARTMRLTVTPEFQDS
jgi:hypothetical protein